MDVFLATLLSPYSFDQTIIKRYPNNNDEG